MTTSPTNASTKNNPGTTTVAGASWEDLVSAALLGTDRKAPPVDAVGREPAVALLDAAALSTVSRRAGLRPAAARALPSPAPDDARPALPDAGRQRLASLLTGRVAGGGRRGTAPDLTELLPQWLAAANRHGYRAPDALVPALLDAARARTDLRREVLAFTGARGLWLARLNTEWKFVLRGAGSSPTDAIAERVAGVDAADPEGVRRQWEEGLFAERVSLLTTVRRTDAPAGLDLLGSTWSTERAEDRLMFLDTLRTGLSPADEPFLEQALADRSRNVRAMAAELLSTLPGSALAGRMAERAGHCVSLDRSFGRSVIGVTAPSECDTAMQRDGVVVKPPAGRGERAWWLGQLVEAADLGFWGERFGGRAPAKIVSLSVADDWQPELHAAWGRAAVRQRDSAWARALLGAPSGHSGVTSLAERTKLLAVLPADERAAWVARYVSAHGLSEAFQFLGVCAVPWTAPLGSAVVDALDIARDAGSYPWSFSGVMGLAERCLDPTQAGRLQSLTSPGDEPEDASPGAGGYWSEAFQRLVGTLQLRATMLAELEPRGADAGSAPTPDGEAADSTAVAPTEGSDPGAGGPAGWIARSLGRSRP